MYRSHKKQYSNRYRFHEPPRENAFFQEISAREEQYSQPATSEGLAQHRSHAEKVITIK